MSSEFLRRDAHYLAFPNIFGCKIGSPDLPAASPRTPLPCSFHLFSFISTQLSASQIKRGRSLVLASAEAFEVITSTQAEFPGSQTAACRPPLTKAAGLRARLISAVRSIRPCQHRRRRQPSWGRLGLLWSLLYFGRINKKTHGGGTTICMQINNSILSPHLLSPLRHGAGCIFRRPPSVCRSRSSAWHEMNKQQQQQKKPNDHFFPSPKAMLFLFPHGRSLLSVISPLSLIHEDCRGGAFPPASVVVVARHA